MASLKIKIKSITYLLAHILGKNAMKKQVSQHNGNYYSTFKRKISDTVNIKSSKININGIADFKLRTKPCESLVKFSS